MLEKYPLRSPSTAYRTIDGVALIVGGAEGKLHTLNKVGTFIWERSDAKRTLSEIANDVCQEFDVERAQAVKDIERFVMELESRELLTLVDVPVRSGASS